MKLSSNARKDSTVGEIVNLMAVDSLRYSEMLPYINMAWIFPVQCSFAIYFLWDLLGPSSVAGLSVFILKVPLNFLIGHITKKLQVN